MLTDSVKDVIDLVKKSWTCRSYVIRAETLYLTFTGKTVLETKLRKDLTDWSLHGEAWKERVRLHEFKKWADAANSRVMMAVNLGTRGITNAPATFWNTAIIQVEPNTVISVSNTDRRIIQFKTWCLGNEMDGVADRSKTMDEYGSWQKKTAKAMAY